MGVHPGGVGDDGIQGAAAQLDGPGGVIHAVLIDVQTDGLMTQIHHGALPAVLLRALLQLGAQQVAIGQALGHRPHQLHPRQAQHPAIGGDGLLPGSCRQQVQGGRLLFPVLALASLPHGHYRIVIEILVFVPLDKVVELIGQIHPQLLRAHIGHGQPPDDGALCRDDHGAGALFHVLLPQRVFDLLGHRLLRDHLMVPDKVAGQQDRGDLAHAAPVAHGQLHGAGAQVQSQ